MLKGFIKRVMSWILLTCLVVMGAMMPAQALQLTGSYQEDGQAVVKVIRTYLEPKDDKTQEAIAAQTEEAEAAIEAFYSRYRGRYGSTQSFTTLQTVFNTLASNYRARSQPRALKPAQKDRVLTQLDRAEVALKRER